MLHESFICASTTEDRTIHRAQPTVGISLKISQSLVTNQHRDAHQLFPMKRYSLQKKAFHVIVLDDSNIPSKLFTSSCQAVGLRHIRQPLIQQSMDKGQNERLKGETKEANAGESIPLSSSEVDNFTMRHHNRPNQSNSCPHSVPHPLQMVLTALVIQKKKGVIFTYLNSFSFLHHFFFSH